MSSTEATCLPDLLRAVAAIIRDNAAEVTELDQAIGDGDHVFNLQRGIDALLPQAEELSRLEWGVALQKIGMTVMSTIGGASGPLYGTLFIHMSKAMGGRGMDLPACAEAFAQGVEAVKVRGKADLGDKTMLDVLIPAARALQQAAAEPQSLGQVLAGVRKAAEEGLESTRGLLAAKGRASFLGERAKGHLDAGAKTSQLMIEAIAGALTSSSGSIAPSG